MRTLFDTVSTGAEFSECLFYRYRLRRIWGDGGIVNFIMLNPSTAGEVTNDPTVERCQRRASQLGFGGLVVTNLFAFRATDPREMKAATDPVGPENDKAIELVARKAQLVIAAWGNHGSYRGRAAQVRAMFASWGIDLHSLKVAKTGEPMHPLYLPYELKPELWPCPA